MSYSETGLLADPSFRRERARKAAAARTTTDHYIAKLVEAAPPLTDEQRAKLSALLRPVNQTEARAA